MFQKTLRKLTALNSMVFLLIFIIFGATLYGYVAHYALDRVDDVMRQNAEAFRILNGRPGISRNRPALFDPRTFILLRDTDGEIINPLPFQPENAADIIPFLSQVEAGTLQTRKVEDHIYRVLVLPYKHAENTLIKADGSKSIITEVMAISIVDSEAAMLSRLMSIIISGLTIGMLAIILAGYFLARHALIPIRVAWEKQQQFVADASHELRTPLTVIKTNAELLLRHPEHTIQEESARVTNVIREAMRMNKLVGTLLTLARADANQIELHLVSVSLNNVIGAITEQFQPLAELKGIALHVDLDEQIELIADKERLHQLFVILLDNAIKYTPKPGRISLVCRRQFNQVLIKVEDNGCGIPPDDLPYVFDRFFRGNKARTREDGGTGLGLAIARWIIEKHGGKIRIESAVGIGTQVHINIPLKQS
mgnify:CR=1 FL=1